MKNIITFIFLIVLSIFTYAQPQSINYQGVARNSGGLPLLNQNVSLRLSILEGSSNGQAIYVESQNVFTNNSGLFNLGIGTGTIISGTFSAIQWGQGNKWLQVEMDSIGGNNYQLIGVTQFLSVPYALYANTSGNSSPRIKVFRSSDIFTVPLGVTQIVVEVWGAGGGGGGGGGAQLNQNHGSGGGGGSGGCYKKSVLDVVSGQIIPVNIGLGGMGGNFGFPFGNGTNGTSGQSSSFGNLIQSSGGTFGGGGSSTCYCSGGFGGASSCDANSSGTIGGGVSGGGPGSGGKGGDGISGGGIGGAGGGGGGQPGSPPAQAGSNGTAGSGGGGAGGASWWVGGNGGSGGKGGDGLVIVYF